ncbi:MAG: type III-A CRISPR-associated RAMP protein Csm3 [Candidatus Cloacimonadaceae bacterium]|nr:type III-A CRISPR-associated RAMP protein Csm3 [Bacteroidales bacterium]MDD3011465.1 type III-A CRISPR-associated RAMP protein Csm3 [Bacteroidales bacterium]MDD3962412.1 type III-A CRISPR-associated RAMP protein Csm3 [Bacteroidales bacterium]MDY0285906.1 type III-A CRISPR-associated RAMP protein Csm3 [Bacteroidales bacterium]NCD40971.1 type III-A CRISPR-associated RAMP protein Csm3 [Bacteroidia bacterium]
MNKLIKKIIVRKQIELLSGLHIGASSDNVEIGGVDKPVIRQTLNKVPFIPGSSLKGKIRCLLEQASGVELENSDIINNVFGSAASKPSKLIFRDALMTSEYKTLLSTSESTDMPYTELKWENKINRLKAEADPRQIERVPAGARFDVEIVINVWDNEDDGNRSLELLNKGIKYLEMDYLGGNGSRGYGKVIFHDVDQNEESLSV